MDSISFRPHLNVLHVGLKPNPMGASPDCAGTVVLTGLAS